MYVKTVVLDGFKSYGKRTAITGFDKEFNAITGLNGTGKSNILDAICFVLGISNLGHVRAGSLQELVYKSGQAGVTKATVSITFDNRNKRQCPLGYESHDEITVTRQIIIGGKNKYLINGTSAQNKRVTDLFCSVQLNVNNPNFLIMQGRITKVLNMKPPEILSMIEEAAGTGRFEAKRASSYKLLERKDAKLTELAEMVSQEIGPRIERLKSEKALYQDYQKSQHELSKFNRKFVSYRCHTYGTESAKAEAKRQECEARMVQNQIKMQNNIEDCQKIDERVQELSQEISAKFGGQLGEWEKELKEKSKKEASIIALHKASEDTINADLNQLKQLQNSLEKDKEALRCKEIEKEKVEGLYKNLKDADTADSEALAAAQERLQAASAGLSTDDQGRAASLHEQLINAEQAVRTATFQSNDIKLELEHTTANLKKKLKEANSSDAEYQKDKLTMETKEREVKRLEAELSNMNYSEEHMRELQTRGRSLEHEVQRLTHKVEEFDLRNSSCTFLYPDPEPGFDRRKVFGRVCNLFKVTDPKYMTALETAAGGKLYNVIVDTDVTGAKILKLRLQGRVTCIPLNKIQSRAPLEKSRIAKAQKLGGAGNVFDAMSLIEYDNKLKDAMEFIFGNIFICTNMVTARTVGFDNSVSRKCVTLDGDVVDPSGTMSGGSRARATSVLQDLADISVSRQLLAEKEQELAQVKQELRNLSSISAKYEDNKQRYELNKVELNAVQQRLQNTTFHMQQVEIKALQDTIDKCKEMLENCKKTVTESTAKTKDLKDKIKDSKGHQEREMKAATDDLNRLKKKSEQSRANWKKREQECETLNLEITELVKVIEDGEEQIKALENSINQQKSQLKDALVEVAQAKQRVAEIQALVKRQKDQIAEQNNAIGDLMTSREEKIKENVDLEVELKKDEHELKKFENEAADNKNMREQLVAQNPWVKNDEHLFGRAGSPYDFETWDIKVLTKTISRLQETIEKMERNVNTRAMSLLGKEEEKYANVMKRRDIVEADKRQIQITIEDLEEKKKQTLQKAWEQVNKDFGSIFATLLPGSMARLTPPDGMTVLEGLEVKVGFNSVWKESLNELSGGQRSLVALSLILAMLLFNPAPLYILDEVDAALDLSHTQNIGQMLKSHFKTSQFIIVSLKEGMFNNANVLFRTSFVNGMSTVQRTVHGNRDQEEQSRKRKQ